jgi:hypothetical protein
MQRSSQPRTTAELSKSLHERLNTYALAASAAGVGMLALVRPAEAKIVYTPAHVQITPANWVYIDLNHDGINDFVLENKYNFASIYTSSFLSCYSANHGSANRVRGDAKSFIAFALRSGVRIGAANFPNLAPRMAKVVRNSQNSSARFGWPWANGGKGVKSRYLGLQFTIKGKTHFGWARLNVTFTSKHLIDAVLTGYAYETIPGKAIVAGATKGPDDGAQAASASIKTHTPTPAMLGTLALGAPGLSIWRRES